MKFSLTADLHLSRYYGDQLHSGTDISEKLWAILNVLKNIISYSKENSIRNIVLGGDIFHNKSIIYSQAQSLLLDLVRQNEDIKFIILDGNHDMSSKGSDSVSSLKCLDSENNVITIHEPKVIENILFVPWKHAIKEFIKSSNSEILISHFGINEAILSSGVSIVSDISCKDLDHFKFVLLGHYHKNQNLVHGNTQIYYVGSPIQLDWSEKHEDKRFLIFDTETLEVESILTEGYKKHFELIVTNENKSEVVQQARELKAKGDYVILKKTEKVDTSDISKDFAVVDKSEKVLSARGISMSMSEKAKIERYVEVSEVPQEDREWITNEALDIVQSTAGEV